MIIWDCDYDDNKDRIISENYVALKRERKPKKREREKKKMPAQLNKYRKLLRVGKNITTYIV